MKVNFSKLTFKPSLASPEITRDLTKEIAEVIYQNANSLAQHSFAQRLYESKDGCEANEEEIGFIKGALPGFKYYAQEAILKAIGEK